MLERLLLKSEVIFVGIVIKLKLEYRKCIAHFIFVFCSKLRL